MPAHEIDDFHNIGIEMFHCRAGLRAVMIHEAFDPLEKFEHAPCGRTVSSLSSGMHDLASTLDQAGSQVSLNKTVEKHRNQVNKAENIDSRGQLEKHRGHRERAFEPVESHLDYLLALVCLENLTVFEFPSVGDGGEKNEHPFGSKCTLLAGNFRNTAVEEMHDGARWRLGFGPASTSRNGVLPCFGGEIDPMVICFAGRHELMSSLFGIRLAGEGRLAELREFPVELSSLRSDFPLSRRQLLLLQLRGMNDDVAPESRLRLAVGFLDRHRHFERFASVDRTLLGRQQNRQVTLLARKLDEFASQRIGFRHQGYDVETQLVGHGKRGVGAKFAVGHQYDVAQHIEHAGQFFEMVAELLDVTDVSVLNSPIQRNPGIAHGHADQQLLQIGPMIFTVAKCRNRRPFDQRCFDFENRVVIAIDAYRRAVEVDSADFDPKLDQAGKDDGRLKPFRLAVKGVQSFAQTGVIEELTTKARAAKEIFKIESGQYVLDFRQSVGPNEDRAQHGLDALPVAHNVKFMLRHDFVDQFSNSQTPQVAHQNRQGTQPSTITDRFYRRRCICKIGHDNNTSGMYCRKSTLHRANVQAVLHQFTLSKTLWENAVHRKCGIDVKTVESFISFLHDVKANKGIMITNVGYSEAAYNRAYFDTFDLDLKIIKFEDLEKHQGFIALSYAGPYFLLVSAPDGWIIDGRQCSTMAGVCRFYPLGLSYEEAFAREGLIYLEFNKINAEFPNLDALVKIQNENIYKHFPSAKIDYDNPQLRNDARTLIRIADISHNYNGLEYTAFLQFQDFMAFIVLLEPKDKMGQYYKVLKWISQKAFPGKIIIGDNNKILKAIGS